MRCFNSEKSLLMGLPLFCKESWNTPLWLIALLYINFSDSLSLFIFSYKIEIRTVLIWQSRNLEKSLEDYAEILDILIY